MIEKVGEPKVTKAVEQEKREKDAKTKAKFECDQRNKTHVHHSFKVGFASA
jgi:hypothetical protein